MLIYDISELSYSKIDVLAKWRKTVFFHLLLCAFIEQIEEEVE